MTKEKKQIEEARETLKKYIKPSSKIIIFITSVSRSGMTRRMKVYTKDLSNITYLVGKLIDWSVNDEGIKVGGCGMDMAFHLADTITWGMGWKKSKLLKGNGGSCIDWECIY